MQLMPETAADYGVDPYNTAQNVFGGMLYLRDLVDEFGFGDNAIAAYNAGSGNVNRYGGVPPFAETQNYVAKVGGFLGRTGGAVGGIRDIPNLDDYVEYKGYESADGLTELTKQKVALLARDYFETFGEKFFITATNDDYHRGTNSWHEYGQAVDFAMDSLYDETRRQWLAERARYYNLVPLDEYSNPSERSTAPHYHLSDHGEELEKEKMQSTGARNYSDGQKRQGSTGVIDDYWHHNKKFERQGVYGLKFDRFSQAEYLWDQTVKEYEFI